VRWNHQRPLTRHAWKLHARDEVGYYEMGYCKRCSSTHSSNSISTLRITPVRSLSRHSRKAFDSLIEAHCDPPTRCDLRMLDILLRDWQRQLVPGGRPPVLLTGELKPRYVDIIESLKPENRPYFEVMVKELYIYSERTLGTRQRGKEILHELGCVFVLDGIMVYWVLISLCSRHEEAERSLLAPFYKFWTGDRYEFVPPAPIQKYILACSLVNISRSLFLQALSFNADSDTSASSSVCIDGNCDCKF
jgi:hypothetical protein